MLDVLILRLQDNHVGPGAGNDLEDRILLVPFSGCLDPALQTGFLLLQQQLITTGTLPRPSRAREETGAGPSGSHSPLGILEFTNLRRRSSELSRRDGPSRGGETGRQPHIYGELGSNLPTNPSFLAETSGLEAREQRALKPSAM